jgi:hypothetical protein
MIDVAHATKNYLLGTPQTRQVAFPYLDTTMYPRHILASAIGKKRKEKKTKTMLPIRVENLDRCYKQSQVLS